jgi:hypothetical protein
MSTSLRAIGFFMLTGALAWSCKDSSRSDNPRDANTNAATAEAGVDAGGLAVCSDDAAMCDAGTPARDASVNDAAAMADAGSAPDAGPLKPPVDAGGVRDAAARDSGSGCANGARKCNLSSGAYGICTPSGACGGCTQSSECVEVYGGGFSCDSANEFCFPQI